MGKLASVFATLAIAISCLGLFSLTAYTTERRTNEIGIRKELARSPGLPGGLPGCLVGGCALLIALLTTSWQALKAASANRVRSLRME